MLDFDLAIRRGSVAELKRLCRAYGINTNNLETKSDYVGVLAVISRQRQLQQLRTVLLAGRGSMALFRWQDQESFREFEEDFSGEATDVPQVVYIGAKDQIMEGFQHVIWTMLDGQNAYLDKRLQLKVAPEAAVIDTFWDEADKILQVRAGAFHAEKIRRRWAELAGVDPAVAVETIGIHDVDQFEAFAERLDATVEKCRGRKNEIRGFLEVSGKKHPDVENLVGTPDYNDFKAGTDPLIYDMRFTFEENEVRIGLGFVTRSVVFYTNATEEAIDYVYSQLKIFLDI